MTDFWKSRKFAYALGTFLAAVIVALLSGVEGVTPEQVQMLENILPIIFVTGVSLIVGHAATDITATWRAGVPFEEWKDALVELVLAALNNASDEAPDAF